MSIVLTGKLRQSAPMEWEGNKKTKLWLEHEMARDNGPPDLRIEELFLEGQGHQLPEAGKNVSLFVRPYAAGKAVKFQAVGLVPATGGKI